MTRIPNPSTEEDIQICDALNAFFQIIHRFICIIVYCQYLINDLKYNMKKGKFQAMQTIIYSICNSFAKKHSKIILIVL